MLVCALTVCGSFAYVLFDYDFSVYCPTDRVVWSKFRVDSWRLYLKHPSSVVSSAFNAWLLSMALAADVPSLSLALQQAMKGIVPSGANGATQDNTKSVLVTSLHVALSVARLSLSYRRKSWPSWFKARWKVLPSDAGQSIGAWSASWFRIWVQCPVDGCAAVY